MEMASTKPKGQLADIDKQHVQLSVTNLIPFEDHKDVMFDEQSIRLRS
jgi:hypothetical protein